MHPCAPASAPLCTDVPPARSEPTAPFGPCRTLLHYLTNLQAAGIGRFVYLGVASELANGPIKFIFGDYVKGKAEAEAAVTKDFGTTTSMAHAQHIHTHGTCSAHALHMHCTCTAHALHMLVLTGGTLSTRYLLSPLPGAAALVLKPGIIGGAPPGETDPRHDLP